MIISFDIWTRVVNFTNVLRAAFAPIFLPQKSTYLKYKFKNFQLKLWCKKTVCKILVNLDTMWQFQKKIMHGFFVQKFHLKLFRLKFQVLTFFGPRILAQMRSQNDCEINHWRPKAQFWVIKQKFGSVLRNCRWTFLVKIPLNL